MQDKKVNFHVKSTQLPPYLLQLNIHSLPCHNLARNVIQKNWNFKEVKFNLHHYTQRNNCMVYQQMSNSQYRILTQENFLEHVLAWGKECFSASGGASVVKWTAPHSGGLLVWRKESAYQTCGHRTCKQTPGWSKCIWMSCLAAVQMIH